MTDDTQGRASDPPSIASALDKFLGPEHASILRKLATLSREQIELLRQIADRVAKHQAAHPGMTTQEREKHALRVVWDVVYEQQDASIRDLHTGLLWESDRGCVLVAAAIIDGTVESLLREFFKSRSAVTKQDLDFLFTQRPMPPLQSTALKIRLAFACGLIDSNELKALSEIQSLRSKVAAHSRATMELSGDQVDAILKSHPTFRDELKADPGVATLQEFWAIIGRFGSTPSQPKLEFAWIANHLIALIEERVQALMKANEIKAQSSVGSSE